MVPSSGGGYGSGAGSVMSAPTDAGQAVEQIHEERRRYRHGDTTPPRSAELRVARFTPLSEFVQFARRESVNATTTGV